MKHLLERLVRVANRSSVLTSTLLFAVLFTLVVLCLAQNPEAITFRTPGPVVVDPPSHIPEMARATQPVTNGDVEVSYKSALAAIAEGDFLAAKKTLSALLQNHPEHVGALVNLGWIAQREKAWAEAESYLKRAQKISSDNASISLALGVVYLEQNRMDFAVAALSLAVAIDPSNARAHRMLGIALGRKGWQSAAESELRRSLELEPNDSGAHYNLAVLYLQRQPVAIEMARRHYHRAIDLGSAPDDMMESLLKSKASTAPETSAKTAE